MSKTIIKPNVMSVKHVKHPYADKMLMFKPTGEREYHRYPNPNKEMFEGLRDGKFGPVHWFYVLKDSDDEFAQSYNIIDVMKFITEFTS